MTKERVVDGITAFLGDGRRGGWGSFKFRTSPRSGKVEEEGGDDNSGEERDSSRKSTPGEVASAAAGPVAVAVGGALLMSLQSLWMNSMSTF